MKIKIDLAVLNREFVKVPEWSENDILWKVFTVCIMNTKKIVCTCSCEVENSFSYLIKHTIQWNLIARRCKDMEI